MNNISITNIYWMLAYAFGFFKEININKVAEEKFKNIYDLLAFMMAKELSKLIKHGLNKEYILLEEETSCIKGKIEISASLKKNTLMKRKLICNYDEYSINSYMNQIIKTACQYLLKSNKIGKKEITYDLQKKLIYFKNVDALNKNMINWNLIYNKNNSSYKILINISYLIIEGLLANNKDGSILFKNFIDEKQMPKLFEKFVLEYYKYHHKDISVSSPKINWNIKHNELSYLLPQMKTDIVLKYQDNILIIDAKYYSNIFQKNTLFNKDTFHSHNLYQIFTYVKNRDIKQRGNVSGMLLYVKNIKNDNINVTFNFSGNNISILTLDLSKNFDIVRKQLDAIAIKLKQNNNFNKLKN